MRMVFSEHEFIARLMTAESIKDKSYYKFGEKHCFSLESKKKHDKCTAIHKLLFLTKHKCLLS